MDCGLWAVPRLQPAVGCVQTAMRHHPSVAKKAGVNLLWRVPLLSGSAASNRTHNNTSTHTYITRLPASQVRAIDCVAPPPAPHARTTECVQIGERASLLGPSRTPRWALWWWWAAAAAETCSAKIRDPA